MKISRISLLAVTLSLAMLPHASAVSARIPYQGPAVMGYQGVQDCDAPDPQGMGIVCMGLPDDAEALEFRVDDASGLKVGGAYYLHRANGEYAGSGVFCGLGKLTLPEDAATAVLRFDPVNGPLACVEMGVEDTGPATQGIVAFRTRG